jgi:hemerythrin
MGYFDWSEQYELGISEIDAQHRGLLAMLQDFYSALEHESLEEASDALLARMQAYAERHFATEEAYLKRYGYPDLAQHEKQHRAYEGRLKELLQRRKDKTLKGSLELTNFLKGWWQEHILKQDMAYRDWLRERGAR